MDQPRTEQWPLGHVVPCQCSCGAFTKLTCLETVQRVCAECGGLHTEALFTGACGKCERVHEQRALVGEDDEAEADA